MFQASVAASTLTSYNRDLESFQSNMFMHCVSEYCVTLTQIHQLLYHKIECIIILSVSGNNKCGKAQEKDILAQGIEIPQAPMTATKSLPLAGSFDPHQFSLPPSTAGMARTKPKTTASNCSCIYYGSM